MPVFKKIPQSAKAIGAVAGGRYAVFCVGLLKACAVIERLQKADQRGGIPAYGYITYKGERVYYCLYGFVDNPDTYEAVKG